MEKQTNLLNIFLQLAITPRNSGLKIIKWLGNLDIENEPLFDKDIMFGITSCERDLFVFLQM